MFLCFYLLDYTSTKGAIVAFTRGLSNQLVGEGIRVVRLFLAPKNEHPHYHYQPKVFYNIPNTFISYIECNRPWTDLDTPSYLDNAERCTQGIQCNANG